MLPPQRLGRPPIAAAARRRGTAVQSRLQADATQGHACTLPAIEVRAEKPALLQCLRPPVGESRWRVGGALSRGNLTLQIANHTRVTGVGSPTHKCPTVASVVSPRRLHRRVFVLPRKHKRGAHTHAATAHDDETHTPRRTQRRERRCRCDCYFYGRAGPRTGALTLRLPRPPDWRARTHTQFVGAAARIKPLTAPPCCTRRRHRHRAPAAQHSTCTWANARGTRVSAARR